MKKRIVAVLLSLTLSSAMLVEAGAAAFTDTGVSMESQNVVDAGTGTEISDLTEMSDFTSGGDNGTTGGGTENGTGDAIVDGTENGTGDAIVDGTENGTGEVIVDGTENGAGDAVVDGTENGTGDGTEDGNGGTPGNDFTSGTEGNTDPNAPADRETVVIEDSSSDPSVDGTGTGSNDVFADDSLNAEAEIQVESLTVEEDEALQTQAAGDEQALKKNENAGQNKVNQARWQKQSNGGWKLQKPQTGNAVYYTSKDGLVEITTLNDKGAEIRKGKYTFDGNGYLITGRSVVNGAEYYFLPAAKAGNNATPTNSNLGQMQKNVDWFWEDGAFHRYGGDGRENVTANTIEKIGSDYYYLLSGGKPYVGRKNTTFSGRTGQYCFQAAANSGDIPGKMLRNGWTYADTKYGRRWLYFASDGRWTRKGCGAYKLLPAKDVLYVLDKNGYLVKNRVVKGANGYYYMSNKYGHAYRNKLVKVGKYRYYFIGDGRRATFRNRWVRLPGAGNRYYYFGNVRGRIQEKHGFQKITVGGKFIGWFYFSKAGNHYIDYFSGGRYFRPDGRLASGVCKVNGRYYFFERSSRNAYRGKMYKGTWIKYNGSYYYAGINGNLATNGWRTIRGSYYYFKSLKAVTNTNIKRGDTYGRLDSRGKFVTGWMVANNAKNKARYMDPSTGKFLRNTSKKIDGLLYYFDSNGYRKTDLTNIYKGPYYLEVDRINGVMTVFNKNRTVPVKTIRVSVGNPISLTSLTGKYLDTVKRAGRWQLLMGPSWGQYGSHVKGGIYIHSVASGLKNANNLPAGEYLKLGSPASHGCIRCCVADAKWVWDNCNGAKIKIFDGAYKSDECFKGPLGRNPLTPLRGSGTFDPTDPLYN